MKTRKSILRVVGIVVAIMSLISVTVWGVPPPPADAIHFAGVINPSQPFLNTSTCYVSGSTCTTEDFRGLFVTTSPPGQWWMSIVHSKTSITMTTSSQGKWSCFGQIGVKVRPTVDTEGELTVYVSFQENYRDPGTATIGFTGIWGIIGASGACSTWDGNGTVYADGTYNHSSGGPLPNSLYFPENRVLWTPGGLRMVGTINKDIVPPPSAPESMEPYFDLEGYEVEGYDAGF